MLGTLKPALWPYQGAHNTYSTTLHTGWCANAYCWERVYMSARKVHKTRGGDFIHPAHEVTAWRRS